MFSVSLVVIDIFFMIVFGLNFVVNQLLGVLGSLKEVVILLEILLVDGVMILQVLLVKFLEMVGLIHEILLMFCVGFDGVFTVFDSSEMLMIIPHAFLVESLMMSSIILVSLQVFSALFSEFVVSLSF